MCLDIVSMKLSIHNIFINLVNYEIRQEAKAAFG